MVQNWIESRKNIEGIMYKLTWLKAKFQEDPAKY